MIGILRCGVVMLAVAATTLTCPNPGLAAVVSSARAAEPPVLSWRFIFRGNDRAEFETVSAVSQRDAWVAGDYDKTTTALILHWNGRRWHSVRVPEARGFMPLYSDESSASDVWFVGYQNTASGQTSRALRWTAKGWRSQPMPAGVQGSLSLRVLSGNDAWLANALSCPSNSPANQKCTSLLWHWNGETWRQYELPVGISSLAGSSSANVWASGYKGDGGKLNELQLRFYAYRWTGSAWSAVPMGHPVSRGCMPEIDTTSERDVWMTTCAQRRKESGLLLHWNGRKWQQVWNLPGEAPIIDGRVGVWLSPTMRWTPHGVGIAELPTDGDSISFPDVIRVPGTTTLLAVGETFKNAAYARTYMAIVGGPFGPYRSSSSPGGIAGPALRQARIALPAGAHGRPGRGASW
jgi:hypothetical protein